MMRVSFAPRSEQVAFALCAWLVGCLSVLQCPALQAALQAPDVVAKRRQLVGELEAAGRKNDASREISIVTELLALDRETLGTNSLEVGQWLKALAGLHTRLRDWVAASQRQQELQTALLTLKGTQHWLVADATAQLTQLRALSALDAMERTRFDELQLDQLTVRDLLDANRIDEAVRLGREVCNRYERSPLKRGPLHASALADLGAVYELRGELQEAVQVLEAANEILEETYPPARCKQGHPETANVLMSLAGIYRDLNRFGQARRSIEQAKQIFELTAPDRGDKGVSDRADSHATLGDLHESQHEYQFAVEQHRHALRLRQELPKGPESRGAVLASLIRLGACIRLSGAAVKDEVRQHQLYDEAERHLTEAITICRMNDTTNRDDLIVALTAMARLHFARQQYGDAKATFLEALSVVERVFPSYAIILIPSIDDASAISAEGRNLIVLARLCTP